ncbi:hypothetical protein IMSAG185_00654 [Lachnospiraceae bacterium]|nr:TetR/AcrR family transcriptional regulator [Lachnospiraceae bacterium]MCX4304350.1 TetR/AcrR family transcriptional regulator [Acetatifactor sp.]GFI65061.1 hypothetical protein IMSAG185_00654 [Lachnospiraceae bacterium]
MGKMTGLEEIRDVPPKVLGMYRAVVELIEEGADIAGLRVSTITDRAGIGKGTAYEYFETKEEIVACAMVYYMQWLFDWLGKILLEKESFREQLDYLLDEMEKENGRKFCFLRFVHILTDNSEFSQLIRQKLGTREAEKCMPMAIFEKVLRRAVERGELRDDLPMDYMVYSVFAHLLTYMMAITTEQSFHVDPAGMRPYVFRGILGELCRTEQKQG